MKKVPTLLLIAGLACAFWACDHGPTTQPSAVEPGSGLAGEWTGSIGSGTLELVFKNRNKSIAGSLTMNLGTEGPVTYPFDAVQWTSPSEFSIDLSCESGCNRILTGQSTGPQTLQGAYLEQHEDTPGQSFYRRWKAAKKAKQSDFYSPN